MPAQVLPAFSELRVKEGNALTDVADLIQSYSGAQNMFMTLRQALRGIGHALLPSYIAPEPYIAIGSGMKLSHAYAELTRMGRIQAIRQTNAAIKQAHFEQVSGMVPPPRPAANGRVRLTLVALLLASLGAASQIIGRATRAAVAPAEAAAGAARPWWMGIVKRQAPLV